jgi:hypothetical protein
MDSSVSPKDKIWFLRVCHHISTGLYCMYQSAFRTRWFCQSKVFMYLYVNLKRTSVILLHNHNQPVDVTKILSIQSNSILTSWKGLDILCRCNWVFQPSNVMVNRNPFLPQNNWRYGWCGALTDVLITEFDCIRYPTRKPCFNETDVRTGARTHTECSHSFFYTYYFTYSLSRRQFAESWAPGPYYSSTVLLYRPGSSVGIATELRAGRYGDRIPMGRDFPLSILTLGPTQLPVQWVPSLSRG